MKNGKNVDLRYPKTQAIPQMISRKSHSNYVNQHLLLIS